MRMQDIARAAGISRQAVYLHFGSRPELLVAITRHAEEVFRLDERLIRWEKSRSGVERLAELIEVWGNFLPSMHGVARALLAAGESDGAAAAAWDDRMTALRRGCRITLETLERDGLLDPSWTLDSAVDLFWTLLSVRNWDHLIGDCGWTQEEYKTRMLLTTRELFVAPRAAR